MQSEVDDVSAPENCNSHKRTRSQNVIDTRYMLHDESADENVGEQLHFD